VPWKMSEIEAEHVCASVFPIFYRFFASKFSHLLILPIKCDFDLPSLKPTFGDAAAAV